VTARPTARPLLATAVALTVGVPAIAVGQEVGPYDPLGIRAGGFLIYPSLSLAEVYSDNVFAVDNNKDDDLITVIEPQVRAESNFSRHRLGLTVGSEITFHLNEEDEDYQDFFISSDGQLDITRQNFVTGELLFARDHRDRDDPEDEGDRDELTQVYRYGGDLGFTQLFNRINFTLSAGALRSAYTEPEDADEDEVSYNARLRTGYFVSPRINTFIEGRYNVERRDREEDFAGIERDSQGWGASVGAAVDLTNLLVGEFSVGYRRQYFDEGDFDEEDGIGYDVDLTWTPTLLTTVTASGGGDFRPTTEEEAEANFRSSIGIGVEHELLRNVVLAANVGYNRDDFSGEDDRIDQTITAGGGVSYLLNRYFSIDAGYNFTNRWSDDEEEEFSRNLVRIGVTGRL
jgi:hypothetical protein